jgi:hypothetical protein
MFFAKKSTLQAEQLCLVDNFAISRTTFFITKQPGVTKNE